MSNKEYMVESDHLAVGLTRPPMFMGVNMRLFFANIATATLICIDAHTVLGIPLFFAMHLMMVKCSVKEASFFMIWLRALIKTPPVLNNHFWGKTNSYEPW